MSLGDGGAIIHMIKRKANIMKGCSFLSFIDIPRGLAISRDGTNGQRPLNPPDLPLKCRRVFTQLLVVQ